MINYKYYFIFGALFIILCMSFSLSCLAKNRNWVTVYDVQSDKFIIQSGLTGSDFKFPNFLSPEVIDFICGPADLIRLFIINDLPASETRISDSKLREFIKSVGIKNYKILYSIIGKQHLVVAHKDGGFIDFDTYKYKPGFGFTKIE